MSQSLRDVRVLDLSRVLAGPFAAMLLGDLGAEVVKVERPGSGDDTRTWGPPWDPDGHATYFEAVNRNKRSLATDLSDPRGVARVRELARSSDVLVENFRSGTLDRRGLGYDALRADNERLIFCSITGFGATSELPGYDLLVQALGGLMSITGPADGQPHKVGVALVDVLAGLFATVGILAALRHRELTGEGQRVEVNLLSSLLAALANQGTAYTMAGVVPTRMGNAHPSIAPYEPLRAADAEVVVAVGNDRQFHALCTALGDPQLAEDARFATNADRVRHRAELRDELERRLAARPAADWVLALSDAGVPAGVVNDIEAAFDFATRLGLDPIVELPRADGTAARLTSNPIQLSATPVVYRHAPPRLPEAHEP